MTLAILLSLGAGIALGVAGFLALGLYLIRREKAEKAASEAARAELVRAASQLLELARWSGQPVEAILALSAEDRALLTAMMLRGRR